MTDRGSIVAVWLLVLLLASPATAASGTGGTGDGQPRSDAAHPRIVAIVPNAAAEGDAGERVVVEFPTPTNASGWTVSDGESAVGLPNRTRSGRVDRRSPLGVG